METENLRIQATTLKTLIGTNVEICVTFKRRKPTSNEHFTMFSCWLYNYIILSLFLALAS